ncbi:MAG: hypothetical protein ACXVFK_10430 [Solirubrobacteraceae bacterium]
MATATSRRLLAAAALAAVLALAGCGGAARPHPDLGHAAAGNTEAFGWLRPGAAPAGWKVGRLASRPAALAYPPRWRAIQTDPGTFSAALLGPHGRIRGYLNATPQSGAETLANWAGFRVAHNREEGDRNVVRDASAVGLRFRSGTGSCVIDHYATTSARYREVACIVRGARLTTVVVGAALPADWTRLAPQLQRSIASFST